jgi:hypothetical protein
MMYYGAVMCKCFRDGFPKEPPEVIRDFVVPREHGNPALVFPEGTSRRFMNKH